MQTARLEASKNETDRFSTIELAARLESKGKRHYGQLDHLFFTTIHHTT